MVDNSMRGTMQASKIRLPSTVEQSITHWLRDEILALNLRPGEPLGIVELAQRFGASYTPVRGALARLEAEGLVHSIPHRGSVVAPLTADHADLVITITSALERRIMRLGVPRLTGDDLAELDGIIRDRERALADHAPLETMVSTANQIRHIIARHVNNEPLHQQYTAWSSHRQRYLRYCREANPSDPDFMSRYMTNYAKCCVARDAEGAEALLLNLEAELTELLATRLASV